MALVGASGPSLFDIATRLVLPLVTFFLGMLTTYLVQLRFRKRDELRQQAKEIATLSASWYNHLTVLRRQLQHSHDPSESAHLLEDYVSNRLVLPHLLFCFEALRLAKDQRASRLIEETDRFLSMLTFVQRSNTVSAFACRNCFNVFDIERDSYRNCLEEGWGMTSTDWSEKRGYRSSKPQPEMPVWEQIGRFLPQLDKQLQAVTREAASIQKLSG